MSSWKVSHTEDPDVRRAHWTIPSPTQTRISLTLLSSFTYPSFRKKNILTDPTRFTAITSVAFSASVGPKANVTNSYVFCQTLLDIQYPLGIQYSPVATSYHGVVDLELGADGGLETGYYYSGCPGQSLFCVIRTIVLFLNVSMNSYRTVGYWNDIYRPH